MRPTLEIRGSTWTEDRDGMDHLESLLQSLRELEEYWVRASYKSDLAKEDAHLRRSMLRGAQRIAKMWARTMLN